MNKKLIALVFLSLQGCAVGPHYAPPPSMAPDSFHALPDGEAVPSNPAGEMFWQGFQDPLLEQLISTAIQGNYDLQAMLARYQRAAALLAGVRRDQWPSVTAFATGTHQDLAQVERVDPTVDELELFQAGAALNWELDIVGRLRRATQSRRAELDATGADLQALQVAVIGQLATSYFELRGLQQQLRVMRDNVELQQASLEIVTARVRVGRGTRFDELRATAQLASTRAAIPALESSIQANMYRIAVLTGSLPDTHVAQLATDATLPEVLPAIPRDAPGEVLRRRPDIRAAERRIEAASARIGVAAADLFPRFTLSGLLGSIASDAGDLFTSGTHSGRVALGVDWSFLDRAAVRARIDAADAGASAALADYRQTVLLALQETETWLARYQGARARVELLEGAAQAASEAVAQARTRYQQGYIDYFELLTAELELSRARDALAQGATLRALAMVNVYRALAGPPGDLRQLAFNLPVAN